MDQLSPDELVALRADDRGPLCKRIVITFTTIAFISVCLRMYTRIRYRKTGPEDWTIVLAMISSIVTCICQVLQVKAGNGKHVIFVSYPEGASETLKYLYFSIIAYNMSLTITKISILLQYYRIFTLHEMRVPIYVASVIVVLWGIELLFTSIFTCVPVNAFWKVTEQAGATCVNRMALWYTNASINIFTDLMLAAIPVPGIWGLHIPKRQKTALLGILSIGWFVCVVSILRVYALNLLQKHAEDPTYYSAPTAYWSAIEANLAIVCASLPALKPLVVRVFPVFGTRNSGRGRELAASENSHRLHKISSRSIWKSGDDKEKLTCNSSASHAHSVISRPSESEQYGRNIYITKHFEQRVENTHESRNGDQEMTAAEFFSRRDGP